MSTAFLTVPLILILWLIIAYFICRVIVEKRNMKPEIKLDSELLALNPSVTSTTIYGPVVVIPKI